MGGKSFFVDEGFKTAETVWAGDGMVGEVSTTTDGGTAAGGKTEGGTAAAVATEGGRGAAVTTEGGRGAAVTTESGTGTEVDDADGMGDTGSGDTSSNSVGMRDAGFGRGGILRISYRNCSRKPGASLMLLLFQAKMNANKKTRVGSFETIACGRGRIVL